MNGSHVQTILLLPTTAKAMIGGLVVKRQTFARSERALWDRDRVRRQSADRDGVKRRSSSSGESSEGLGAEASRATANVPQNGRAVIGILWAPCDTAEIKSQSS